MTGLLGLAACTRTSESEMQWARAALERNPDIEIVATDADSGVFTIRDRHTGELRALRLDELVAGAPRPSQSSQPAPMSAEESTPPAAASPDVQADAQQPAEEPLASESSGSESVADADVPPVSPEQPVAQPPAVPTSDASGGRVIAAGPGYSISSASVPDDGSAAPTSTPRPSEVSTVAEGIPVERRSEPIVCQGGRLMHLDRRNLETAGDAVRAEDGCELYITNSRIIAGGLGVVARAARVHITNSHVHGGNAAVEASEGAEVYTRSSTFDGLLRRLDTATVHDLGGNDWEQ
nr:MAG: hypothetical protein DIU56_01480 [Pseudomonadota bacterium]